MVQYLCSICILLCWIILASCLCRSLNFVSLNQWYDYDKMVLFRFENIISAMLTINRSGIDKHHFYSKNCNTTCRGKQMWSINISQTSCIFSVSTCTFVTECYIFQWNPLCILNPRNIGNEGFPQQLKTKEILSFCWATSSYQLSDFPTDFD